ncbi:hypothetical protein [Desertivirga arenae]|uniref:hypothetical protein n=1 Tax=Desertivirga arenae TaxID=2810309 RepID=UPI001A96B01B|nr:hypothetical protein [Pedobacter sp. SYSU D00823]
MSVLVPKFFSLKYVQKKSKAEILRSLQISEAGYSELVEACKEQRDKRDKLYSLYKRKGFQNLPFEDFLSWVEKQDLQCYYCGIQQDEINLLISKNKIYTKRITTRGRQLELERILPNETYDNITNLKFCCYWCNNAKSDEFTEAEFKEVAKEIAKIWKNRLK